MLQKNNQGIYESSLLRDVNGLCHGFSTRRLGDARNDAVRASVLSAVGVAEGASVRMKQVHGTAIHRVMAHDADQKIAAVDGLVHVYADAPMALCVVTADCVPLLLHDADAHVIGVAHAGWKGTLGGIATKVIDAMMEYGASPDRTVVVVGPHIGPCCYSVDVSRAMQFVMADRSLTGLVLQDATWYLDLAAINVHQLFTKGVKRAHIDAHPTCTSCQHNEFFSYRKDSRETFGEMLGVIGFTSV